ncbi:preprotein translocase subunit SecA [Glutamicibacter protophormiae]|uniref:Preprotein translocase subunit SecA n=1 Tax=Glutamicibacter protophormiae TaxID=37930 RepID=A0ABS4XUD0_GLUPR|nr:preprotein translocase subunit SecA [Glutamicibacter protophormiae]
MASLLERILRTGDKKTLKVLRKYADTINTLEDEIRELSDEELRGRPKSSGLAWPMVNRSMPCFPRRSP